MKSWLHDLDQATGDRPQRARFQRGLLTILLLAILGVPAFAWVQYRQTENLERLTSQDFSGFEWDAFKLELRSLHLRAALRDAVAHPDASEWLTNASTQYDLFAAQAQLMAARAIEEGIDDEPTFKLAMSQAFAFMKEADPVLDEVPRKSAAQALQALYTQTEELRAQIYPLVVATHDLRLLRTKQLTDEVARVNFYFAWLSAFVVVLGVGWALSAMHNLRLAADRQDELEGKFEESSFSASHDFLTGLANRRLLRDQLDHAIASSKRNNSGGAVIMLDLDNFKPVNDRYGHDAGDSLLMEVARRIKKCVRDVDTVARVGGDEFVVLLGQLDCRPDDAADVVSAISQKLLATVSAPYALTPSGSKADVGVVTHRCTVSMGVSMFTKDTADMDELLQRADAAMYRVKRGGGNRVEVAA